MLHRSKAAEINRQPQLRTTSAEGTEAVNQKRTLQRIAPPAKIPPPQVKTMDKRRFTFGLLLSSSGVRVLLFIAARSCVTPEIVVGCRCPQSQ